MKISNLLLLAIVVGTTTTAVGQDSEERAEVSDSSNIVFGVSADGEIGLYEVSDPDPEAFQEYRLVYDPSLTEEMGDEPIYRLFAEERYPSAWSPPGSSDIVILASQSGAAQTGSIFIPGTQGTPARRLTEEEQRSFIDRLVDFVSERAVTAATRFCSDQSSFRPESISLAGGAGMQVAVTWNVDKVCQAEQPEEGYD